jgi:hypothetical protein
VLGDLPPVGVGDGGATGGARGTTSGTTTSQATAVSASSTTSSGGTGGACCDCDHDGYLSKDLCGADDCDDHDALVHPGQTMYFATPSPNPNVGWDYDCSGTPDPEFPSPIDCGLVSGSCDAGVGFLGSVPACGAAGPWGSCQPGSVPLTCQQHVIDSNKISRCK